jgi:hypothetical protein
MVGIKVVDIMVSPLKDPLRLLLLLLLVPCPHNMLPCGNTFNSNNSKGNPNPQELLRY